MARLLQEVQALHIVLECTLAGCPFSLSCETHMKPEFFIFIFILGATPNIVCNAGLAAIRVASVAEVADLCGFFSAMLPGKKCS